MIYDPVGEKLKLIFFTLLWVFGYIFVYSNITWTTQRIRGHYKKFAWLTIWLLGTLLFSVMMVMVMSQKPIFDVIENNCTVMSYNKNSQKMHAIYDIDGIQYDGHTTISLNDTDVIGISGSVLACYINTNDYLDFYIDKPLFLLYRPQIAAAILLISSTVNSVIFSSQLPVFCQLMAARRTLSRISSP